MKNEEFRPSKPTRAIVPLPKFDAKPCMRGVMDKERYERTGEVVMIEPMEEYVPPEWADKTEAGDKTWRSIMPNKKPPKEMLEKHLRAGMSAAEIAKKYDSTVTNVYNWIRSYGLQRIKGKKKGGLINA